MHNPSAINIHRTVFRLDEYIDYVIYLLLCIYLVVDMYAGYLIVTTDSSGKTQYFKFFFYALLIISVASKNRYYACFILFSFAWMFFSALHNLVRQEADVFDTMSYGFRFTIIPVSYMYYRLLIRRNPEHTDFLLKKVFAFNISIFIINFCLGLMGYGFSSYKDGFGIKGFFHIVTNATGLLYCFSYYILTRFKWNLFVKIIFYFFLLFMALLMGTKAGVLSMFLYSLIDFYYTVSDKTRKIIRMILPLILALLVHVIIITIPKTEFYQHIEKRILNNMTNDDILNALLSGRLKQVSYWTKYYFENFSLSTLFFGLGYLVFIRGGPMEIDFFFVLFFLGVVFLCILLLFYGYLIFLSFKRKKKRLLFFNLIYLMMSLTSGYIWNNVLIGIFYTYINAYELSARKHQ